jgi:hypothetical protein
MSNAYEVASLTFRPLGVNRAIWNQDLRGEEMRSQMPAKATVTPTINDQSSSGGNGVTAAPRTHMLTL